MAATASGKDKLTKHVRMLVDGVDLSGDVRTFSNANDTLTEAPVWGLSDTAYNYLSSGERMIGITGYQALMNDTAVTGAHTLLSASGTTHLVTVLFGGGGVPAVPDPAYILPGVEMAVNVTINEKVATLTGDFMPATASAAGAPWGVTLANAALTATTEGASHDNAAATTAGWQASLHITVSSGGEWEYKVQHSTNDSDWDDLGTFTLDGSVIGSEHLSGTTEAYRYVRLLATRTSGTCTIASALARE
ncbi:MAG: hypothetical protein KDI12_22980 [Anaerolineae bacterium]|nr:hypothetical protein [Anaerolineae bacterium]